MRGNELRMLDSIKEVCAECDSMFKISKHVLPNYSWKIHEKGETKLYCSYACYSKAFNKRFKAFTPERQIEIGWKTNKKGLDDIRYRGR